LPATLAIGRVIPIFAQRGLDRNVVFIGSGRLGLPDRATFAFALGCDMINVAREAMLAIGCIQAQRCHTNHCPTGVATQSRWLMRGLDPTSKSARLANYVVAMRKELLRLSHACGVAHPAMISSRYLEITEDQYRARTIEYLYGYERGWGVPSETEQAEIEAMMAELAGGGAAVAAAS